MNSGPARTRSDAERVLFVLREFCRELQPGDLVPNHRELMQRFEASERSVRWALNELRRQGVIIRRQGARTYIADQRNVRSETGKGSRSNPVQPMRQAGAKTIAAVTLPQHALFDHAMGLLVQKARVDGMSVICHLLPEPTVEVEQLPFLMEEPLGYVVFCRELLPLAEELLVTGHRVVFLGAPYINVTPGVPAVYGDQEQGGYLATMHLIELGHRRLAFCAGVDKRQSLRWLGYQRALREVRLKGVDVHDQEIHLHNEVNWRDDPLQSLGVFRTPQAPTGLVAWDDHVAVILMGQLGRLGLKVPDDVSIVGYGNLPEGGRQFPALTTVHSPMEQQLKTAISLLNRPEPPQAPCQYLMQPTLVMRESTAIRPASV